MCRKIWGLNLHSSYAHSYGMAGERIERRSLSWARREEITSTTIKGEGKILLLDRNWWFRTSSKKKFTRFCRLALVIRASLAYLSIASRFPIPTTPGHFGKVFRNPKVNDKNTTTPPSTFAQNIYNSQHIYWLNIFRINHNGWRRNQGILLETGRGRPCCTDSRRTFRRQACCYCWDHWSQTCMLYLGIFEEKKRIYWLIWRLSSMDHQPTPKPPFPAKLSLFHIWSSLLWSSRSSPVVHELVLSRFNGRRLVSRQNGKRVPGQRSAAKKSGERHWPISSDSRFCDWESKHDLRFESHSPRSRLLHKG